MGITLKRENVVKIADTEEIAAKLEESGFQRVEVPVPEEKVQEEKTSTVTVTEEEDTATEAFEALPPPEEPTPEDAAQKEEKPSGKKGGRKA